MNNVLLRTRAIRRLKFCAVLFVACCAQCISVEAQPTKPILVSAPTSTRAVALDAVSFTPEPFSSKPSSFLYDPNKPTSIMLFVTNLSLKADEDASALTADAEDATHRRYNLKVEYVGKLFGQELLSQVNLRLDGEMGDVGDVLVSITCRGVKSNRVRVGIGHVGGGPEDDDGAAPTPAPPYTINGRITSGAAGFDGVEVTLSGSQTSMTTTTDIDGSYSFVVSSAGNYIITPSKKFYTFTPPNKAFDDLSGNRTAGFSASLSTHTISGVVADRSGRGVRDVAVALSGASVVSITTDANGRYSFSDLPAGKNYNVIVAKTDYTLNPESRSYNLSRDETADFNAIRLYRLKGRMVDNNGKGIYGILMSLSGPETGRMLTAADGSYSFTVATEGDYKLTPSKEQDFYQFSPPSQSYSALSDNQTTNFTGTIVITSPTHVLEFDGTPMSDDHGIFWPQDKRVGNFFWEFWAMPGENTHARYLLSDGYGGAHALLFGFNFGPRGYSLFGNIWDGTNPFYYEGDEGPSVGEWGHYAVGWDGKNIMTYYDGVPVGKTPFAGPRVSTGTGWGATLLLIGGSTHQNLIGRIAQVRGYEENNPRESSPESSFAPQTVFSVEGQLLSYYFRPAERVADLSNGNIGDIHAGWPRGMLDFYFNYSCPGCPIPKFVIDPTAPDFSNPSNPGRAKTLVLGRPATPGSALVFDSFARDNSTYILGAKGGLGATEAGTAGAKSWQTNSDATQPQPFGILGGRAVLLADVASLAWVSTGASDANLDVRVERTAGVNGSGVNTGLCFRVMDKNNFFFAYTTDDEANPSARKRLTLGYYQSGTRTVLASGVAMPQGNWKTLRVVTTQAGLINVYADNALVHSINSTVHAFATGAGLYNHAAGMGLSNRWDNFTVLVAP